MDRAVPAARGTGMRSVVTSAGPRGVTGRHLGDPVRRRDPTGTGRSPRLVGTGDMGPINYWGYQETPVWDPGFNQWGFWFFGVWIPL